MNKREFIKKTAKTCEVTETQARKVINAFTETIRSELQKGETVTIDGFGKFYTIPYKGRELRTPQGATITLKDRRTPKFKPSNKLKRDFL